jgi:hypothetical protein
MRRSMLLSTILFIGHDSPCAQKTCLDATNGLFDACEPHDLKCLCSLKQSEITRYVEMVQPCIDGDEGSDICTDGAIYRQ